MTYGIFIGRFQPAHRGHIHALSVAASQVSQLLVLVGSANRARSIKNPWLYEERVATLRKLLLQNNVTNVQFAPINDYKYNDDQWITDVVLTVKLAFGSGKHVLFGHFKDGNNYLNWFPNWQYREINSQYNINATQVRQEMFDTNSVDMPITVREDYAAFAKEEAQFANYPYRDSLNINCGDAVLVCQGKVLLVRRAKAPGRDSWALPGGHKLANETFLDAAIRELIEETNVRVSEKVLRGSIVRTELFDDPTRSGGSLVRSTLAVLIKIAPDPDGKPPRANGQDDAAETRWVDIFDALNNYRLYDDHGDIISKMTGTMPLPACMSGLVK